jgi:hypothetical protein
MQTMEKQRGLSRGELFLAYIKMRRSGLSAEAVVEELRAAAFELTREERHDLGRDVMEWEESQKKREMEAVEAIKSTPIEMLPSAPALRQESQEVPHLQPSAQSSVSAAFGTRYLNPAHVQSVLDAMAATAPRICPLCGKENAATARRCARCDAPLISSISHTRPIDSTGSGSTGALDPNLVVYLAIRGLKQPMVVNLGNSVILGRSVANAELRPHVDLAAFDGEKLGVSRAHASLRIEEGTVVVTDLKSSNATYVNGQRLYPHETRVLRHGDELRLGRLPIKVLLKL